MRRALVIMWLAVGLSVPETALAAGGAPGPSSGGSGVSVPGSATNLIAVAAGPHNTMVEQVARGTGAVLANAMVRGSFGVPAATQDGTATGLSADGRTLVLEAYGASYPPTRTQLLVLNARSLRVRYRITLRGPFTTDAISPTGHWLYLTHYNFSSSGPHYQVRVYDLARGRLLAGAIVDPRHPREKMEGVPLTRVISPGGDWAYTLYQSFSGAPFIHALDTSARRAYCIDLAMLGSADLSSARLVLSSGTLRILSAGFALASMDTHTLAVSGAPAQRQTVSGAPAQRQTVSGAPAQRQTTPPAPAPKTRAHSGGATAIWWPLAGICLLALTTLAVMTRRRRAGGRGEQTAALRAASPTRP